MLNQELKQRDLHALLSHVPYIDLVRTREQLLTGGVRGGSYHACLLHHLSGRQIRSKFGFRLWVRDIALQHGLDVETFELSCRRLIRGFDEAEHVPIALNPGVTLEEYQKNYPFHYPLSQREALVGIEREIEHRLQRASAQLAILHPEPASRKPTMEPAQPKQQTPSPATLPL